MVVWELVFMLLVLKIPLVYLCVVVWWAIRAEPREEEPVAPVRVEDTPEPHAGWSRPRHGGGSGAGRRPSRGRIGRRPTRARAEARR
jgi:hypothetical protein